MARALTRSVVARPSPPRSRTVRRKASPVYPASGARKNRDGIATEPIRNGSRIRLGAAGNVPATWSSNGQPLDQRTGPRGSFYRIRPSTFESPRADVLPPNDPDPPLDTAATAEFAALTTDVGQRLLGLVAGVDRPGPSDLARWRNLADPGLVAAAARLVESRRRGRAKFDRADRMWFSTRGLEQATAEAVARHKSQRFTAASEPDLVVDLCSGIGGDALAIARSARVVAVDLDPAMAARTRWNAGVYEVDVQGLTTRAEELAIPPDALVHVDPDRRATADRKANAVADYVPGLEFLLNLTRSTRGGAIKLGPASDFAAHFGGPEFEVEVTSLGGECKEATIWFGDRATPGIRRRATSLPSGATWTDRDGDGGSSSANPVAVGSLDRWVYDPDPALIRAGLLDGFARAQGCHRIEAGVDLLTGSGRAESPLVSSFEVVAEFPLDVKTLRREVATRGLGPLEIKTRGLATRPEAYRAQLRPEGPNPATWILLASRTGPGRAILAYRHRARELVD